MAVLERARSPGNRRKNLILHENGADGRIATAETLRERHEIGADPFLLAGMQRARAPHPAHHLVENEQHAMTIADLTHALKISWHCGNGAQCGADHGLGEESDDILRAKLLQLVLDLAREPFPISLRRLVGLAVAIFVNRRNVMRLDQQRSKLPALPFPPTDRERAERNAMIALAARNDVSAAKLAPFHEILARELERRLNCFGAAANEKHVTHPVRRARGKL